MTEEDQAWNKRVGPFVIIGRLVNVVPVTKTVRLQSRQPSQLTGHTLHIFSRICEDSKAGRRFSAALTEFGICFWDGRDWTERREGSPGGSLYLSPSPAALTKLTIIRECTRLIRVRLQLQALVVDRLTTIECRIGRWQRVFQTGCTVEQDTRFVGRDSTGF